MNFKDRVYFRIDQSYFSGYDLDKAIDELNYFKCLFGSANLFKSINLDSINNIKKQSKYAEAHKDKNFLKYLNLLNFGKNLKSSKINFKESSDINNTLSIQLQCIAGNITDCSLSHESKTFPRKMFLPVVSTWIVQGVFTILDWVNS